MSDEFDLMSIFFKQHSWDALIDIAGNAPYEADMFRLKNGEYIQYFYQTQSGTYQWMYYSTHYAEWFPNSTNIESNIGCLIPLGYIKKFRDAWVTISKHDGISNSIILLNAISEEKVVGYKELRSAVDLYLKFDKYISNK